MPPLLPALAAVVVWLALLARYCLKVRRGRRLLVLLLAAGVPLGGLAGALSQGFTLSFSLVVIGVAAVIPWLATNFKPELMIDAEYLHGRENVTEEQEDASQRYQMRAVLLILLIVAVGAVLYWDRIPE